MLEFKCPQCGSAQCESVTYQVGHGSHIETHGSHQIRCRGTLTDGRLCAWCGTWPQEIAKKVDGPRYLEGGEEVEVLAEFDDSLVVSMVYENEYDDPMVGEPFIIHRSKVFESVLVARKQQEIANIENQIQQLKNERESLRDDVKSISKEITELRYSYQQLAKSNQENAAMLRVWQLITGEIKYLVFNNYYDCVILPIEKATARYGYSGKIRLLSLFGESNGNLSWKLNEYANGNSSSSDLVYPCLTLEEAQETANPFAVMHLNEALRDERHIDSLKRAIDGAIAVGCEVDAKYTDALEARLKKQADEKIAALEAEIAKAKLKAKS